MIGQNPKHQAADPHPEDEEGKHPVDVKGQSHAARELRDNMAVNGYTHDDEGNRTGGELPRASVEDDRDAKQRSAKFLVEEFDVRAEDAADLVADTVREGGEIEDHERERENNTDPLEDVPTPVDYQLPPEERVQKHMHKEVVTGRKA